MGDTARERFHQKQQGNEATTQAPPAQAQQERAPAVFAGPVLVLALAKLNAARTEKRREELLGRIKALGVPMEMVELSFDQDELDELEAVVEDLENGR